MQVFINDLCATYGEAVNDLASHLPPPPYYNFVYKIVELYLLHPGMIVVFITPAKSRRTTTFTFRAEVMEGPGILGRVPAFGRSRKAPERSQKKPRQAPRKAPESTGKQSAQGGIEPRTFRGKKPPKQRLAH